MTGLTNDCSSRVFVQLVTNAARRMVYQSMRLGLGAALAAFICVACDATGPDALRVSVTASPAVVTMGDTVTVHVTILNTGSARQQIYYGACDYHFDVLVGTLPVLGPYGGPCIMPLYTRVIEPGDTVMFERRWGGELWATGERTYATPGTYRIVGLHPVTGKHAGNRATVEILVPGPHDQEIR